MADSTLTLSAVSSGSVTREYTIRELRDMSNRLHTKGIGGRLDEMIVSVYMTPAAAHEADMARAEIEAEREQLDLLFGATRRREKAQVAA